jgi:hypothetical protein
LKDCSFDDRAAISPVVATLLLQAWSSHVDPAHDSRHTQQCAPLPTIAFVSNPPDGLRPQWRQSARRDQAARAR